MVEKDFVSKKKRAKKNVAANLSNEEYATIQAVIQWRKEKGLSTDQADFIRQLIHFVINKEYKSGYDFLLPSDQIINQLLINNSTENDNTGTATA